MSEIKAAELFCAIPGFVENKYSRWYEQLVQKALLRETVDGYKESHHIVPKSFGGSNDKDNLVNLSAREHYIAHMLLWKMRFSGKYGSKMSFAFCSFVFKFKPTKHLTYKVTSRIYETFRKEYAAMLSGSSTGEGNHFYGKKHSDETKKIIGEKSKLKEFKSGSDHPNWGKKINVSEQGKLNKKIALEALWNDPVRRKTLLDQRKIINKKPEVIANRRAAADKRIGVKRDPALVEKIASMKRGKKEHEIYSPEAILIRKEALKNRKLTDEGRERIRESTRKLGQRPKSAEWRRKMSERMTGIKRETFKCEHCGMETVLGNIRRWHGDNCKMKVNNE